MGVADRRLVHKLRAALKIATDTLEVLTNEAPFTTAWAIKKINATIAPENHP
jgi:hypothetical protein